MAKKGVMSHEDVQQLVRANIDNAKSMYDVHAQRRTDSMAYYRGELPGPPIDDERSNVVSRDVRDTVEAILPSLIRIFCSSDNIVEYIPRRAQDVEAAKQATEYFNFLIKQKNGLKLLYPVLFDSMARFAGIVKVTVEEREESSTEEYDGIPQEAITVLLTPEEENETVEVLEQTAADPSDSEEGDSEGMGDAMEPGMLPMQAPKLYHVKIRRTTKQKELVLRAHPHEERMIHPEARDVETADFYMLYRKTTVGDLLALGYDEATVDDLESGDDFLQNDVEKFDRDPGSMPNQNVEKEDADPSMRSVLFGEAYMRFDYDGDGKPSLYRICVGGRKAVLLADPEEVDCVEAAEATALPEPHVATGRCMSEDLADIQITKTNLIRGMLDSLAQSIFPQRGFMDGAVNVEDLKNNEPGALVRVQNGVQPGNAVMEFTREFNAPGVLNAVAYFDDVKESRSGISKEAGALDADSLQSTTAIAAAAAVSASRAQVEMRARILADYFFAPLAKIVLRKVVRGVGEPFQEYVNGAFKTFDPRGWSPDMAVRVNTALGRGTQAQRQQALGAIAAAQKEIIQTAGPDNPLAGVQQYHNTLVDLVDASELPNPERYFSDPSKAPPKPPQQPPPDPNMLLAQAEMLKAQAAKDAAAGKSKIDYIKLLMEDDRERDRMRLDAFVAIATKLGDQAANVDMARIEAIVEGKNAARDAMMQLIGMHQDAEDTAAQRGHDAAQAEADRQHAAQQAEMDRQQAAAQAQQTPPGAPQ